MRLTLLLLSVILVSGCTCGTNPTGSGGGSGGSGGGSAAGGGSGGVGGGGTGGSGGGTAACGQYATRCNGVCIPTVNDPSNCGACGKTCLTGEVCTGGSCLPPTACPVSLTACNGRCVDLKSSNQYCGACTATAACAAGKGCSAGACVASVALDGGGPANCAGGGPALIVGPEVGPQVCAGALAQTTFRWGLCSCAAITTSAAINTDGFSSNLGPVDGGPGGSVGANGLWSGSSTFNIGGAVWLKGALTQSNAGAVKRELHVDGITSGGGSSVSRDAFINGDVNGLSIGGKLFVPTGAQVLPNVTATGGVVRGPVSVPTPCDCDPSQLINVKSIVAHGKAVNDNASIGLDTDALTSPTAPIRLDLPCGKYFLKAIHAGVPITIAVHGRTALFVEDGVSASQDLAFYVDTGAELDVFIGGDVSASGQIRFGSPEAPALSRFYLGQGFTSSSGGSIAGNFYLPKATFSTSGPFTVYGSVFCGALSASSTLNLHYDSAILNAGRACGLDAGAPFDGGTSSADGGQFCGSCRDCGNQACVGGKCGACTDSSQCCSPLICSGGICLDNSIN